MAALGAHASTLLGRARSGVRACLVVRQVVAGLLVYCSVPRAFLGRAPAGVRHCPCGAMGSAARTHWLVPGVERMAAGPCRACMRSAVPGAERAAAESGCGCCEYTRLLVPEAERMAIRESLRQLHTHPLAVAGAERTARGGRAVKLEGAPAFNGKPLSKRAKRQVGFVLQARPARWQSDLAVAAVLALCGACAHAGTVDAAPAQQPNLLVAYALSCMHTLVQCQ